MMRHPGRRRGAIWAGLAVAGTVLALLSGTTPAMASNYATLQGSGSSWASVALVQWGQDLASNGLTVNFQPNGSASGRSDYEQGGLVHFAASDPPFRNGTDELANDGSELPIKWGYSYVPDVGGGTAFMYHVTLGGRLITNLRLSEQTLMEIFTGTITNWSDPAITKDYGTQLPNEPIIPVIRSDGSGATYFLTRWMEHVFPSQWNAFCQKVHSGIKLPCPQTEFYPQFGNAKQENGSTAVSTFITSSYGEGSIGYDEYAYALNDHWPVVAMQNPAGYDVLPTASNVAVALTQAQINENQNDPNFLQQNLDNVYTYNDPRSYPLSSYSYLIVPTGKSPPPIFNNAVGKSLSTYIDFYLCQGQQQAGALGYSPLPINLVKGAFLQVNKIPGTVGAPNLSNYGSCNNPTFVNGQDKLLSTAPYPNACQKATAALSCNPSNPSTSPSGSSSPTPSSSSSSGSHPTSSSSAGTPTGGTSSGAGTGTGGTGGNTGGSNGNPAVASSIDPNIAGGAQTVPGSGADRVLLAVITALAVALAVAAPPSVAIYLRRRRGR